jgi:hypothetical protein
MRYAHLKKLGMFTGSGGHRRRLQGDRRPADTSKIIPNKADAYPSWQ